MCAIMKPDFTGGLLPYGGYGGSRKELMLRTYAWVAGMTLIILGVASIPGVVGDTGGPVKAVFYLGSGGIFFYTGFSRMEVRDIRGIVGGMGVLYLVTGVFVVSLSIAYELPPLSDYDFWDDYGRVALGSLSIFVARFLPCRDDPPAVS